MCVYIYIYMYTYIYIYTHMNSLYMGGGGVEGAREKGRVSHDEGDGDETAATKEPLVQFSSQALG